ncbi:ATP phosphoribosyltransferase regulatory subunit [Papillibacter cinnamivorans]|uniref:ATP phosphoribosyltransferase regulatory subunit n=1 Tax=Papillibacter cinnamivorans DSM 12816 TaxID=1122930 RepID=A0A1W1YLV1_9FIRM|nr:ATP phosphoribosyltransferase regulatory subunit [Papillibacter cinnamivorans]SMC37103.1 ATP phosphoribosyltransferase regulatory subunit [Papillibacter cinnamivorans DSM 12816]
MKPFSVSTPEGTKDLLYSDCLARRGVQAALGSLFRRRGYSEIITPEVEYYDLFLQSGNPLPQEAMRKLVDQSGKILVMRPDNTAPIARICASRLQSANLPLRLYYSQTVFRSGSANRGRNSEIAQCGVELIGAPGRRADLEMVATAVQALEACGVSDFRIELGHAGFFRALAAQLDLDEEAYERLRGAVEGKNFASLEELLDSYGKLPAAAALRKLSMLFGGAEVLDEARSLFDGGEAREALDLLAWLYKELSAAGMENRVQFDLGLVHQLEYYTGVVFRGYAAGAGSVVLSGGRYDNLMASFGRPAPATGFAVDVDAVAGCLAPPEPPVPDTVVHYAPECLRGALRLADSMPPGACQLSPYENPEESVALAGEKGAKCVVFLDNGTVREVKL